MNTYFILNNAVFSKGMNVYELAAYAAITSFKDKNGTCYPARNTLAEKCGVSLTTVKKVIRSLTENGYIKKSEQFRKNGSQTSNLYELCPLSDDNKYCIVRRDIFDLGLSAKAIAVYLYLSYRADRDGSSFPSKSTIASGSGISVSGVNSAIKELQAQNLITATAQIRPDGGHSSNIYTITKIAPEVETDAINIDIENDREERANTPYTIYAPHPLLYMPSAHVKYAPLEAVPMLRDTHKQVFKNVIQDKEDILPKFKLIAKQKTPLCRALAKAFMLKVNYSLLNSCKSKILLMLSCIAFNCSLLKIFAKVKYFSKSMVSDGSTIP